MKSSFYSYIYLLWAFLPLLIRFLYRREFVTALQNHWFFKEPRLMYMHWENVGDPFEFAIDCFEAACEDDYYKTLFFSPLCSSHNLNICDFFCD
ncbi:DUF1259 domain-containing protein [Neobacillus vireti]|uniref:DUF1259 domain-containing protein n=1 Tax=Neobacillus vireti TaxID=220686 RepID=UPI002FFDAAD0